MLTAFVNTAIILVVSVAGTILIGSMAAYAIDRFSSGSSSVVSVLFLLATLVPGVTTQVATFQIVNGLGLFNTRWSAILLFIGTDIVSIYIFLQFIRAHPPVARRGGADRRRRALHDLLPDHPAAAEAGDRDRRDHQGHRASTTSSTSRSSTCPSRDLGVISTSLFRFKGRTARSGR